MEILESKKALDINVIDIEKTIEENKIKDNDHIIYNIIDIDLCECASNAYHDRKLDFPENDFFRFINLFKNIIHFRNILFSKKF